MAGDMGTMHTSEGLSEETKRRQVLNRKRKSVRRKRQPSKKIPSAKACEILEHGEVHGKKLTSAQRGMFGAACARGKS